jgi:predicted nucleotide-binding protein
LFVGCSVEALPAARALQRSLDVVAEVAVWDQDLMTPSRSTLDNVVEAERTSDFAVFVLAADDVVTSRGRRRLAARDKVVFELGIAFGALGSGRTFFVVPRVGGPAEFADLAGIQAVSYSPPGERGWGPAMGPVASPCRIMDHAVRPRQERDRGADPDNAGRDALL